MSGATDADAGAVSGVFNTAQQVGGSLGIAVLTTLAAARTGSGRTAQALTEGYHLAWDVGTGLAVAAILVAAIALRAGRTEPGSAATEGSAGLAASVEGRRHAISGSPER
jgi:hypothetical protein